MQPQTNPPKLDPNYRPTVITYRDNFGIMIQIKHGLLVINNPRPNNYQPEYIAIDYDDLPFNCLLIKNGKIIQNLITNKKESNKIINALGL